MKKKIKVGIWGLGRAGLGMHVPGMGKFPEMFEIVAGCDIDKDRLTAAKEKIPAARLYEKPEDFLNDKEIELVTIATRSPDHVAHCLKALAKGFIVFQEKPIALTYADAKKLKKAHQKYPGKLFIRHNRRFEPAFMHIRDIMDSGVIGDVYEVKLHRHSYQRRNDWQTIIKCGGGQLNNWGPHIIDQGLQFLDSPVTEIWSDVKKVAAVGDAEDHFKIILKGKNGRIVDIEISNGVAIPQPEFVIFGTRGALISYGEISKDNSLTVKYIDPEQKMQKIKAYPENPPLTGAFGNSEKLEWVEKTIAIEPAPLNIWKSLYEAIREKKKFPISIDQALEVVRITELVRKNSRFI